jgi:hypothetical protein
MNPFVILVLGVIGFIVFQALYWALVEIPRDHAKDEAICETCFGKTKDDSVTECLEWCRCPEDDEKK